MSQTMGDSVTPLAIPKGFAAAALYFNGLYAADRNTWEHRWPHVWWIDVLGDAAKNCSILDIETGDATPETVKIWVPDRLLAVPNAPARLYCNLSTWYYVKQAVATLNAEHRKWVRYWIANPTGSEHIVPGSQATQWAWRSTYDISAYNQYWTS